MHNYHIVQTLQNLAPVFVLLGGGVGYLLKMFFRWLRLSIKGFVKKVNHAHDRLDKVERAMNEVRIDLEHVVETMKNTVTERIDSIEEGMSAQFGRVSESIEKILVLMVKLRGNRRKDE